MRLVVSAALLLLVACEAAPSAPAPGPGAIAITIDTVPPGASVLVDGKSVGLSPATVALNPGPHRIKAAQSGYYPLPEQKIQVSVGEPTHHTLALVASH